MGGGKHTTQNNVSKKPRNYTSDRAALDAAAGAGTGSGGYDREAIDACLVSFKTAIKLDVSVPKGTVFVLTAYKPDVLQLVSGGKRIGTYTGKNIGQLQTCMTGGYIYKGKVGNAGSGGHECAIWGEAPYES